MSVRHNFVAQGWDALHQAALDAGAEVDYHPSDYLDLRGRHYINRQGYEALVSPLMELSGVDADALDVRASVVKAALWRWLRRTAIGSAPTLWKRMRALRNRTALLADFSETQLARQIAGTSEYVPSDPYAVISFGYRLIRERACCADQPIIPILWGLAMLGAVWGEYLQCGYCELCFRRSRPNRRFCDFHSQSGVTPGQRSASYMRYRQGRLAKALVEQRGLGSTVWPSEITRLAAKRQTLPNILFQLRSVDGLKDERAMLLAMLAMTPRVVQRAKLSGFRKMPFEDIVLQLSVRIDPYEWEFLVWGTKVLQAEAWFALEDEVLPGRRGSGKATSALVCHATQLAASGIRNGNIAAELDVAPSTVSRWMQRYCAFNAACALRDAC